VLFKLSCSTPFSILKEIKNCKWKLLFMVKFTVALNNNIVAVDMPMKKRFG